MTNDLLRFDWNQLPLLTQDPGTGGYIRSELEDFKVFELPLYPASGQGEHIYVHFEKRGHNTRFVLEELERQLGIELKKIGVAGLKDRHAVTRQWISFPEKFLPRLDRFSLEGFEILEVERHTNRLGMGHLTGNRFEIRVRGADGQANQARKTLDILLERGLPNYFGPQRFGINGRNAEEGLRLIQNGLKGRANIHVKRFLVSSLQSMFFNLFLAKRLELNLFDGLLVGDMAKKHDTGGVFLVEHPQETERAQRGEISALGTLPGRKVKPLTGEAGSLEQEVLGLLGLDFESFNSRMGDRRLTRIFLRDAEIREAPDGYWVCFSLPRGSFATSVLREIMKTEIDSPTQDEMEEEGATNC
ncbi:MAG: tRNA pseudouridine(13) synthase TruD [Deinococcaceae bacterium]